VILVDSSVRIDLLNNVVTEPVLQLRELIPTTPLLIADLILCEVLQGFRTEAQARPGFYANGAPSRLQTV
jgi:hypothetical protein